MQWQRSSHTGFWLVVSSWTRKNVGQQCLSDIFFDSKREIHDGIQDGRYDYRKSM